MSAPHKKGGLVTAALLALLILSVVDLVHTVECPITMEAFGYPNRCTRVNQQLYYGRPPDHNGCGASWFSWLGDIAISDNGRRCCRAHDVCFSMAGTPMGLCNEEFAACLAEHTSIASENIMAGLVNLVCPSAYAPAQNEYLACTNHLGEVGYVGCFQDSSSSRVWAYQHKVPTRFFFGQREFTVQSCRTECASRRFTYAGLQYGSECWCGNNVPAATKLADSMCNKPCVNDNMQLCGGDYTMSVYKTGYMGCFADQSVRDLPEQMSSTPLSNLGAGVASNTGYVPVTCMAECHSKGYRYAAVQYGGECFCGNTYGGYGPLAASSCQVECRAVLETGTNGRVPMYCGGGYANQIYDTQITLSGFKPYSFAIKTSPNGDAGKCLEWNSQAGPSIPNLTAQTCSLNAGQQFITTNDGYIRPLTDNSKCIDAADGLNVGSTFKVSTCPYNGNQRWRRDGNSFKSMDNNSLCMQINHNGWGSVATVQSCSSAVQEQAWKSLGDTINFDLTVKDNYVGSKDIFPVSSKDEVWVDVNPDTNYAVGHGISWACVIKTKYSKILLDRTIMRIDTSRREYTTTDVLSGDNCGTTASVPYGVAASCTGSGEVMSSIDLRGTPYRVISGFVTSGYAAHGSYFTGDGIQISISGGGYCGWQSTPESNALGEESAIIFGGKHIAVDVVGTEFPRQSGITDLGYTYLTRGWYDIQRIGKYNDYCRYVGWPDRRFSCALAGSTNEFVLDNVDPLSLGHLALAQTECAILYADSNFAGDILTFQSGTYNSNFGSFNDKASSLKVAPGCTVSLYSDANKGGSVSHFKNDVPFLTFQNDIFSSGECLC